MIYTTLNTCKENDACEDGYKNLLKHVELSYPKNKPISLLTVLESNGLDDALWALQNASIGDNKIFSMKFGVWCAEQCYQYWEKEYPYDDRVKKCIDATYRFIKNEISQEELAAARVAARDAARVAARDAAGAAARAAARDAAWAAARAAAGDAAGDAEKQKQIDNIKKYLRS